ncbi:MAG: SDR family NAD(P)-dependent oxidoreductase [Chloroflexi bacterium]|nr:SDR family NAD(P)-dependent oxidoreductase [Chloroflexota bacterium]
MPYRAAQFYDNKRVMVTGGLGFIGSNLARQLVDLGARVLLVDSLIAETGANPSNIAGIEDRVSTRTVDIRDALAMERLVAEQDVIFNLAGQVSHIDSMRDPFTDLEINCRAQLSLLESCRRHNPGVKVVFASTRQIYGRPDYQPVDERHLLHPTDVNGINKMAGEWYHILYNNVYGVRACSLRLTNTYGPRMLVKNNRQTAIGWFIRQILDDEEVQLFGDGMQLRDFTYVDDASDAFLRAGASDVSNGQVFNIGGPEPISLRDLLDLMIEIAGVGSYRLVPFPPEKKAIDIGSVYADYAKIERALGWTPKVDMREGLERTLEFYREHRSQYWGDPAGATAAPMAGAR